MKQYVKTVDGKTTIRNANRIIVIDNDTQTINPTEEMILADGWVEYVRPEPTAEELLQNAKVNMKNNIRSYDLSTVVNEFFIDNISVWLDKSTRAGLKLRFEAEIAIGKTTTTLWYGGKQFVLSLENAMEMLYAIEAYASACYDNTQRHLANIDNLITIEDVDAYDYQIGYPEKLNLATDVTA